MAIAVSCAPPNACNVFVTTEGKASSSAAAPAHGRHVRSCWSWWSSQDLPASATAAWICYVALAALFPWVLFVRTLQVPMSWRLLMMPALPAVIIMALEAVYSKVAQRPSTGLQFDRWAPSVHVIGYKLVGFHIIFTAMGLVYFVIREYDKDLYIMWFKMLREVGPYAWVVFLAYVVAVDGFQSDASKKADLYHNLGRVVLRQGTAVQIPAARWHNLFREYLVKAYFLPVMIGFFKGNFQGVEEQAIDLVRSFNKGALTFREAYGCAYEVIYLVDTLWLMPGYLMSAKLLDTHVRSAEPTVGGWVVALACYPPFVDILFGSYTKYNDSSKNAWGIYFDHSPRWLFWGWGCCILVLSTMYTWATVAFGLRFSNLTNRGVITAGPYALTRHPAYVFKNLSWWMISVPWSTHDGYATAFKRCCALLLVNLIYYARAKTEEAHLLQDPAYVDYYNAMQLRYGLPQYVPPAKQKITEEELGPLLPEDARRSE